MKKLLIQFNRSSKCLKTINLREIFLAYSLLLYNRAGLVMYPQVPCGV